MQSDQLLHSDQGTTLEVQSRYATTSDVHTTVADEENAMSLFSANVPSVYLSGSASSVLRCLVFVAVGFVAGFVQNPNRQVKLARNDSSKHINSGPNNDTTLPNRSAPASISSFFDPAADGIFHDMALLVTILVILVTVAFFSSTIRKSQNDELRAVIDSPACNERVGPRAQPGQRSWQSWPSSLISTSSSVIPTAATTKLIAKPVLANARLMLVPLSNGREVGPEFTHDRCPIHEMTSEMLHVGHEVRIIELDHRCQVVAFGAALVLSGYFIGEAAIDWLVSLISFVAWLWALLSRVSSWLPAGSATASW